MAMLNIDPKRIIVALDFECVSQALEFSRHLPPQACRVKVGKELFNRGGPDVVRRLIDSGFDVFLDLKFHDIPNTVAAACRAAADLGVWMVNVHASGGRRMMQAAREAVDAVSVPPLLIGVTILTSLDEQDLAEVGFNGSVQDNVIRLARLAGSAGLDGVVCSAREAALIRTSVGPSFCLVTPGIRPAGVASDDQKRVMTPAEALSSGSDYLVIGRAITRAPDPRAVILSLQSQLDMVDS